MAAATRGAGSVKAPPSLPPACPDGAEGLHVTRGPVPARVKSMSPSLATRIVLPSPLTAQSTPTVKCMGERPRPQLRQLLAQVPAHRHGPRAGGGGHRSRAGQGRGGRHRRAGILKLRGGGRGRRSRSPRSPRAQDRGREGRGLARGRDGSGICASRQDIHAVGPPRRPRRASGSRPPVRIDDAVLQGIEACFEMAPLHNPPNVKGYRAARGAAGDEVPRSRSSIPSFHQTMAPAAYLYGLP